MSETEAPTKDIPTTYNTFYRSGPRSKWRLVSVGATLADAQKHANGIRELLAATGHQAIELWDKAGVGMCLKDSLTGAQWMWAEDK